MSNENQIQDDILEFLDNAVPERVYEQAIPDDQTVLRDENGFMFPYVAVQFGDLQAGFSYSFAGPRGDDYILPIYIQAIAPEPRIARRLANRIRNALLGEDFKYAGSVRKRSGGGMFPLVTSNGATEAYLMPASFGLLVQFDVA